MRLYSSEPSGNCYKARLLAARLDRPLQIVDVDILAGETRTESFLAKNPNGRVPLLELDDGRFLPESNAILWYLANDTALIPPDPFHRAQVLQWMFFEQYSHEPNIAVARFWHIFRPEALPAKEAEMKVWNKKGHAALEVMESHLAEHSFFAGNRYSIADIALFAYTHVAPEGGFELSRYDGINAWLDRVKHQPGYVPMRSTSA